MVIRLLHPRRLHLFPDSHARVKCHFVMMTFSSDVVNDAITMTQAFLFVLWVPEPEFGKNMKPETIVQSRNSCKNLNLNVTINTSFNILTKCKKTN